MLWNKRNSRAQRSDRMLRSDLLCSHKECATFHTWKRGFVVATHWDRLLAIRHSVGFELLLIDFQVLHFPMNRNLSIAKCSDLQWIPTSLNSWQVLCCPMNSTLSLIKCFAVKWIPARLNSWQDSRSQNNWSPMIWHLSITKCFVLQFIHKCLTASSADELKIIKCFVLQSIDASSSPNACLSKNSYVSQPIWGLDRTEDLQMQTCK